MKIKTGDSVVIISGKDKGKTGQVLRVLPNKNRVVVADANIRTKHVRGGPQRPGEIVKYEASLHASNVMLVDSKSKKRTRVGYKDEKGKKVRFAKRSGEEIKKGALPKKKAADTDVVKKAEEKVARKKESKEAKESKEKKGGPFWKKMGFGAQELGDNAEVDSGSHMKEDHSVPDQIERSSTRGASRGS